MMIAKFGRIVNLEELETIGVNQQLEDVKDRLSVAEAERSNDLQLWNVGYVPAMVSASTPKITASASYDTIR